MGVRNSSTASRWPTADPEQEPTGVGFVDRCDETTRRPVRPPRSDVDDARRRHLQCGVLWDRFHPVQLVGRRTGHPNGAMSQRLNVFRLVGVTATSNTLNWLRLGLAALMVVTGVPQREIRCCSLLLGYMPLLHRRLEVRDG